jgi:hypothetical protein
MPQQRLSDGVLTAAQRSGPQTKRTMASVATPRTMPAVKLVGGGHESIVNGEDVADARVPGIQVVTEDKLYLLFLKTADNRVNYKSEVRPRL